MNDQFMLSPTKNSYKVENKWKIEATKCTCFLENISVWLLTVFKSFIKIHISMPQIAAV